MQLRKSSKKQAKIKWLFKDVGSGKTYHLYFSKWSDKRLEQNSCN